MTASTPWCLRDAERPLRLFLAMFLIVLSAGYAIGLVFVEHSSHATPQGISEQFRGSSETAPEGTEIRYEKSPDEMYVFLHNHVLSLALVFGAVGTMFHFSSIAKGGLKTFLMTEPMGAIVTTFGGIWLTRFVSADFSLLVLLSGLTMALCYVAMVILLLVELLVLGERS